MRRPAVRVDPAAFFASVSRLHAGSRNDMLEAPAAFNARRREIISSEHVSGFSHYTRTKAKASIAVRFAQAKEEDESRTKSARVRNRRVVVVCGQRAEVPGQKH